MTTTYAHPYLVQRDQTPPAPEQEALLETVNSLREGDLVTVRKAYTGSVTGTVELDADGDLVVRKVNSPTDDTVLLTMWKRVDSDVESVEVVERADGSPVDKPEPATEVTLADDQQQVHYEAGYAAGQADATRAAEADRSLANQSTEALRRYRVKVADTLTSAYEENPDNHEVREALAQVMAELDVPVPVASQRVRGTIVVTYDYEVTVTGDLARQVADGDFDDFESALTGDINFDTPEVYSRSNDFDSDPDITFADVMVNDTYAQEA